MTCPGEPADRPFGKYEIPAMIGVLFAYKSPNVPVNVKNGMRPPKQAISPSVVRKFIRPSACGLHHGPMLRPPSPTPLNTISHEYSNVSSFRNCWSFAPPSLENRQVWRFAKPAQNGGTTFWSSIVMNAGKLLFTVRIEVGQLSNTRSWIFAPFGGVVANAEAARQQPASARTRVVIRLMGVSPKMKVGQAHHSLRVRRCQRDVGLRRRGRGPGGAAGPTHVPCPGPGRPHSGRAAPRHEGGGGGTALSVP